MKLLRMECWGLISRFSIHRIEETMWFSHAKIKHLTSSILTHGLFAPTVYNFFYIFCYTRLKLWPNPVLVLIILSQACKNWTVLNTWLFKIILTKLAIDTLFFQGSTASQNDHISVYYDIVFCFDNSLGSDWHQKMWVSIFIIVVL